MNDIVNSKEGHNFVNNIMNDIVNDNICSRTDCLASKILNSICYFIIIVN